jgi:dolichyl-phosphate beta-glucosyltransferase
MKKIHLSVVIPSYNEEKNIRVGAIDRVYRYLEKQNYEWEIIVVDDGSTDNSYKLLAEFAKTNKRVTVIKNPHQGKAATVITGMLAAQGEIALFSDLDQATPIKEVEKILPWFKDGFDVVIGSRNSNREGAPLLRVVMARGFMILRSMLLGLEGISDTQCGFKAFKTPVAQVLFSKLKLYGHGKLVTGSMVTAGFDIELLYIAKKFGYKIKEVPVEWHYVETRRVNPVKDSIQGLSDIISIRVNTLRGVYT